MNRDPQVEREMQFELVLRGNAEQLRTLRVYGGTRSCDTRDPGIEIFIRRFISIRNSRQMTNAGYGSWVSQPEALFNGTRSSDRRLDDEDEQMPEIPSAAAAAKI